MFVTLWEHIFVLDSFSLCEKYEGKDMMFHPFICFTKMLKFFTPIAKRITDHIVTMITLQTVMFLKHYQLSVFS